ncbi:MAG: malate dehydrogenase [candidate division Zixibacteria bacterium]|nr:malate dehydrogenase [candidate division Zixibacteria bacterium]
MRKKVTVVGAGNVGAACAQYLAESNLCDVALVDIVEGMPQGKALDLLQAGPVRGYNVKIEGSNDFAAAAGSSLIVITAGIARKPGMSREDLLNTNIQIMDSVMAGINANCPNTMILVVSNPLDVMTYRAWQKSKMPKNMVFGQAGVLDSTRFRTFVAMEMGCAVSETQAMVLGGHGDSMVPLPRYTTVGGIPITELISKERIDAIAQRTRDGGAEIVKLLKTGSAYYAPAASTVLMADAVLNDRKTMLAASAYLDGQYGLKDVFIGVPVTLGAKGVEKVHELKLEKSELEALQKSAGVYKEIIDSLPK